MPTAADHFVQEDRLVHVSDQRLLTRRLLHDRSSKSDRPLLVFLHEALGSIDLWGAFPEQVARLTGLDALLYDRLGHGGSDPLVAKDLDLNYQEPEYRSYLPAVLAYFDVRQGVLIGHSDGGTLALLYTAEYPERVAAVVTEAAHVFVDPLTTAGIRRTVAILHSRNGLRQKLAAAHGAQKAEALIRRWSQTWLAPEFAAWNVEACLGKIGCPVLVMQGAGDEYGLPAQAEAIVRHVAGPSEMHLIPDCGHVPHHQARETVVDHLIRFLSRWGLLPADAPARRFGAGRQSEGRVSHGGCR
jgi:pimeloyl-ACP methyl ester carboxylesterase